MASIELDEKPIPDKDVAVSILNRPLPLIWRIIHGTSSLIGGLAFLTGSCMYFAKIIIKVWALNIGAVLFIVGSFFFLLADIQEWWHHRIGCIFDWKYRERYEEQNAKIFRQSRNTILERLKRAEDGLNCFTSIIGSALYLTASILFLPDFSHELTVSEALFMAGSTVIYISQGWKVYRIGCTNKNDLSDTPFRLKNLLNDIQLVIINISVGLGALFYFISTILFLPKFTTTDFGINRAAGLFVCGGFFFAVAGIFLQYYYYCTSHE